MTGWETSTTYMRDVLVNGRWRIVYPDFRAIRYMEGPWERERLASMALNLAPTDLLLDVGAETGDMTALFSTWLRDGGVMMMEPNPLVWTNARAIFAANNRPAPRAWWVGFASDTTCTPPGVAAQFGVDGWPPDTEGMLVAAHGFRHLAEETDTTPQITIDGFCEQAGMWPTAVTMDIEGAELQALRGATRLLAEHRPLVWVSVHPEFLRHHFGQAPRDLYRFMEDHNYRVTHLGDDHESHVFFEPR